MNITHFYPLLGGKSIPLWGTCTSPMPALNILRPSVCWKSIVGTAQTTFPSWRLCHVSSKVKTRKKRDTHSVGSVSWGRSLSGFDSFFSLYFSSPKHAHRAYRLHTASSGWSPLSQRFPGEFGIPGVPVHPVHPTCLLPYALPRTVSMTVTHLALLPTTQSLSEEAEMLSWTP